jgi:hypothetical protein
MREHIASGGMFPFCFAAREEAEVGIWRGVDAPRGSGEPAS